MVYSKSIPDKAIIIEESNILDVTDSFMPELKNNDLQIKGEVYYRDNQYILALCIDGNIKKFDLNEIRIKTKPNKIFAYLMNPDNYCNNYLKTKILRQIVPYIILSNKFNLKEINDDGKLVYHKITEVFTSTKTHKEFVLIEEYVEHKLTQQFVHDIDTLIDCCINNKSTISECDPY